MKTIYDANGNSITLDSVDAREYIETGAWFADPPAEPEPEPEPEPEQVGRKSKHTTTED